MNPKDDFALGNRGEIALVQGRFQEPLKDFEAAIQLDANNANNLYGRGISKIRVGRREEGHADIAAALKLDPAVSETFVKDGIPPPE